MRESIKFTKMQGLGNDFVILDFEEVQKSGLTYSELAIKMCDRNFGIGGDGLIIFNPDDMKSNTDTCWRIINSDGSEPEMCGNGIRCFAKYVYNKGAVDKKKFTINTLAGVITPEILDNGDVKVDMGAPVLTPSLIPTKGFEGEMVINKKIEVAGKELNLNAVSMGNPHCIIFTDEDTAKLAREIGPLLEVDSHFPQKTNVEFVKVFSRDHIKIDVWERGCGITLACGTGTCATAVAGMLNNLVDSKIKADLPGGQLVIEWDRSNFSNHVFMSGAAEKVFEGEFFL